MSFLHPNAFPLLLIPPLGKVYGLAFYMVLRGGAIHPNPPKMPIGVPMALFLDSILS